MTALRRAREAKVGRIYACATQTIGGFPFRIEVHCSDPSAEFRSMHPATALKWKDLYVVANVFSPTRLDGQLTGPLMIGEPGQPASMTANWRSADITMRGLPTAPERIDTEFVEVNVERTGGGSQAVFNAKKAELKGRIVEGSAYANPVIEFTVKVTGGTAPNVHPVAASPIDANVTALLRGLRNFAPKTWAARFKEIQAAGGRLDVMNARLQQGDIISLTTGQLGLTPRGRLEGELRMTIVNFDKLLPALGLDRLMAQATAPGGQFGSAIGALDRLVPGLGNVARQNAGPAVAAGLGLIGQPTELEGKRAMMVPLRFTDGMATLGPVPLGPTPPLY